METLFSKNRKTTEWKTTDEYRKKLRLCENGDAQAMYELGIICDENESNYEAAQYYLRSAKQGNALAYHRLGLFLEEGKAKDLINIEDKIVKYYATSAVLGCAEGQKKLADCYYEGRYGLNKDLSLAKEWYKYAADQDNAGAAFALANMLNSVEWLNRARELGSPEAQYVLAMHCVDPVEKEKGLHQAARNGSVQACLKLAEIGLQKDTEESNTEAYKWYSVAVDELKSADAAIKLANILTSGRAGIKKDFVLARRLIIFAADRNQPEALYELALFYGKGNESFEIKKDTDKAIVYLKKAADLNHIEAAYYYGLYCARNNGDLVGVKYLTLAAESGYNAAKIEAAISNWHLGHYEEAIRWYVEAASIPDVTAQITLGNIYRMGNKVPIDFQKSIQFYSMSPAGEEDGIELLMGLMYQQGGYGLDKDPYLAYQWFEKSAQQGNMEAAFYVGLALRYGSGIKKNSTEALIQLDKTAQGNFLKAIETVGIMYANGEGTPDGNPDYNRALFWNNRGAELGSGISKTNLAYMYYWGHGVRKDLSLAFSLFYAAAQNNVTVAMRETARMYLCGEGTETSLQSAVHWYQLAACKGDADSAFSLAEIYRKDGIADSNYEIDSAQGRQDEFELYAYMNDNAKQRMGKAFAFYSQAAESKHPKACDWIGYMLLHGIGCKQDVRAAKNYLSIASDAGIARAQYYYAELLYRDGSYQQYVNLVYASANGGYTLAMCKLAEEYWYGIISPRNIEIAESYLRRAISCGSCRARALLGRMLWTKDRAYYREAVSLFDYVLRYDERGRAYDRAELMYYMGEAYAQGKGVEKNMTTSFNYFSSSAIQGNTDAMVKLYSMYREGKGVRRDKKQAREWIRRAAALGNKYAIEKTNSVMYKLFG